MSASARMTVKTTKSERDVAHAQLHFLNENKDRDGAQTIYPGRGASLIQLFLDLPQTITWVFKLAETGPDRTR